jgi:two-component system phosphate regulon response regulator PhoB
MRSQMRTTVLIVEPDPIQRQLLFDCLRERYNPIGVATLAQAYEAIVIHQPNIILLELNQPDGDGMELIRQIRKDPFSRHMVVACVTRRSGTRDKVTAFQAGADDYVVKPINPESFPYRIVLLTRIRQVAPSGLDQLARP